MLGDVKTRIHFRTNATGPKEKKHLSATYTKTRMASPLTSFLLPASLLMCGASSCKSISSSCSSTLHITPESHNARKPNTKEGGKQVDMRRQASTHE